MKEILSSIFFLGIVGASLWGWNHWKQTVADTQDTRPSINVLATVPKATIPLPTTASNQTDSQTNEGENSTIANKETPKETLDIKTLNGGAAGGSAGRVSDFLKKNGYVKAQAESASGKYMGVTVYYLPSHEADASAIRQLLIKNYPKAEMKAAISSTDETGSSPIVVVLGK